MSKLTNAGQTTLPTGTGGVAIDCGFAPKGVIVMLTGRTSGLFLTTKSVGAVVGTAQRARAVFGTSNNVASDARVTLRDDALGAVWHNPSDSSVVATISGSISGNTLTLTPSASLLTAYAVTWFAVGGDDVSVALRSTVFTNGTTVTVNDCGFNPNCLVLASGSSGTLNTIIGNRGDVAFGAVVGSTQRASGFAYNQNSAADGTSSRFMTNRAANTFAFGAWRTNAITVSLATGGFSINNTDGQSGWTWALCIAGLNVALLSGQLAEGIANVDVTGAGFVPASALAFGTPDNTAIDTNQNATTSMAWGVAIKDGNQASTTLISGFDTNRTTAVRSSDTLGLVTMEKTGVNTYANRASATASFLSDGIRYAFSAGHPVAGRFAVLLTDGAPGAPPAPSGPSPAAIQYYRRLNGLIP
jgi:hypothetical protein